MGPTIGEIDQLTEVASRLMSGENPKQMLELGESARELARRISYKKGEAYGLVYTGFAHWFLSGHGTAVERLTAAQSFVRSVFTVRLPTDTGLTAE